MHETERARLPDWGFTYHCLPPPRPGRTYVLFSNAGATGRKVCGMAMSPEIEYLDAATQAEIERITAYCQRAEATALAAFAAHQRRLAIGETCRVCGSDRQHLAIENDVMRTCHLCGYKQFFDLAAFGYQHRWLGSVKSAHSYWVRRIPLPLTGDIEPLPEGWSYSQILESET